MPAKSVAQKKLMHAAENIKKGKAKPTGKAAKVAEQMTKGQLKDYTKGSTKGLPQKVKKKK
ncbi:MAG: hypothetical protein KAT58_09815 [candidate division Zixibacteria bacterium]|nr:hypothetical protein [candidate division Zixibacteria bacterium]